MSIIPSPSPFLPAASPSSDSPENSNGTIKESSGVFTWQKDGSLSPSLLNREAPSFELKFLIDEAGAQLIADWAGRNLTLDPHAVPELGYSYLIHSLYCDTPNLDVFHRSPGFRRKKYRLRRYGSAVQLFLEQKRKAGDRVSKRRTKVEEAELQRLRTEPTDLGWQGHWFHRRLALRKLQPTCQVSYRRHAYFGQSCDGPMRLTLDRHIHGKPAERWSVQQVIEGLPVLSDQVLLELKFRKVMPASFRALVQDHGLSPCSLSKYRLVMQAWGLGGEPSHA